MQISEVTFWVLAAVVLVNTLFIAGLAVALFQLQRRLGEAVDRSGPVLDKATAVLTRAEETAAHVQSRLDQVLERTTRLVDAVSDRVDRTTAVAEEAVTEPLVGAASLMAGINRGLQVYSERSHERGEGENGTDA